MKLWFRQDFGCRLSGVLLEYLLQTLAFDALVSESRFSLQGLACREQKLAKILESPLPLPHILQQQWFELLRLTEHKPLGLDLLPHSIRLLWLSDALGTRALLWFGHECSGYWMHWEHERYSGLGMNALVIVCSGNTNIITPIPPQKPRKNRLRKSPHVHIHGNQYI